MKRPVPVSLLLVILFLFCFGTVSGNGGYRYYVLACPFRTVTDRVSLPEFLDTLSGRDPAGREISAIYFTPEAAADLPRLSARLAAERITENAAEMITEDGAVRVCSVIPVTELDPTMKAVRVNHSFFPWDSVYDPRIDTLAAPAEDSNLDRDRLSTVLLTGTTALARAVAWKMAENGPQYPAELIKSVFDSSDITHISNESTIWSLCPDPRRENRSIQFCSNLNSYDLLDYLGVDVIELTGNHLRDYDWKPLLEMLDTMDEKGYRYYAAGRNYGEAAKPYEIEHNGNRFVFLGCNIAGPDHVYVDERFPGVNKCDFDALEKQIRELSGEGNLVILTIQYYEIYSETPSEIQERDFRRMSDAGAVIVSGSQAHLPQTMVPMKDRFIHYGLGNLFFDQMDVPVPGTSRELLDRYVFYEGRLLTVEVITARLTDYSRPRLMSDPERKEMLTEIFGKMKD